ncbi:MAG: hypothetical protein OXI96_06365 [Acidimicrobiaceae bacterium]|nr:hypothetical protein [Acidimicrobiaceae bacterium]
MLGSTRRRCDELLNAVHLARLTSAVLDRAGRIPDRRLRSLDAVYVACAEQLDDALAGFVSYDHRQRSKNGLHTKPSLTNTTHNSPQRLPTLLQSPQNPQRAQKGRPRIHHRIQPMQRLVA